MNTLCAEYWATPLGATCSTPMALHCNAADEPVRGGLRGYGTVGRGSA
jgi:hypothetical protein